MNQGQQIEETKTCYYCHERVTEFETSFHFTNRHACKKDECKFALLADESKLVDGIKAMTGKW